MKNLIASLRSARVGAAAFFSQNRLAGFPIRNNVRGYNKEWLRRDLKAGLDVSLLAFPQGMAYAVIAGLPIAYGITCSAVAAIVAPFFASSRLTILGPTNATAFMVFSSMFYFAPDEKLAFMPLLVLMVGILLAVGAFFRFADLIQYISRSVVVGYITGAAILITANQLKHVCGVESSGAIVTTTTDAKGGYLFTGLPAGRYFVKVLDSGLPAGGNQTAPSTEAGADGGKRNSFSSGNGHAITVGAGQPWRNLTADFGYSWGPDSEVKGGTSVSAQDNPFVVDPDGDGVIGNRIWLDENRDGYQDDGEPGLPNITVQLTDATESGRTFFTTIWALFKASSRFQWLPLALAVATFVLFWLLSRKFPKFPSFAAVMVVMSVVSYFLSNAGHGVPTYKGFTTEALGFKVPDLGDPRILDRISSLFSIAFAVAFLGALENSVMAKTLGSRTGHHPDMNQDMFSVGLSNVWTAFLSGMPASGSLTRSALNHESGAATPISSIVSGALCLVGAFTLGGLVAYVPKSVLSALVISIAVSLINKRNLKICYRATRSDAVVLVTTLAAALLMPLHVAIFVGVAMSVILYLRKAARPQLVEYEFNEKGDLTEAEKANKSRSPGISIVHVEGELFFGAAELFRTQIQRTASDPNLKVIILRLKNARHLDATSVMALADLIKFLGADGRHLLVSGAMKDVYRVLRDSGMIDVIGRDNIFMGAPSNPNLSTRNALKRAQELLGTEKAEVHIFYDPNK
jgi:anti-anti-sigma factor